MVWSSAVTVPPTALGVPPVPPALPIVTTPSPVLTVDESPSGATVSPAAPDNCSTAMSPVRSYPTTLAWYVCPLPTSVTLMLVAPETTWLLVRTSPSALRTIPVPAAAPLWYPRTVLMSTMPGSTFAVTEEIWAELTPDPAAAGAWLPTPEPPRLRCACADGFVARPARKAPVAMTSTRTSAAT